MNSGSRDKKVRRHNVFLNSFVFAFSGIRTALWNERNLQIHLAVSLAVMFFGIYFGISRLEWMIILLAIGGMFSLELLNTAIERAVDLSTEDYHPLAKQAKDIAAGAVLVFAIISVIIGGVIFLPKILVFLQ
ncbi:diacylglycerol kinase [Cytobacillus firmus]|uniref:diacylglycerol kinase family protein n=1 Tax=Cytobacillus firmus TaxID=1399 RepID=UPI00077C138E|nr:diacylglycerol kinase family protein [Cytobacillus firmus]MBG9544388.1 diacylglycerol kinase [Cytobacillus firmus]MBG9549535.1 diacylglycerol kinase [Cytobacillus firmus]MBG9552704.1 diacylglycerol kinase [Cytobacillus firmus]MBG9556813.1 diacylglycerol kinase [Cytobacillus firmus]MBG9574200.1 diacylglycerol kinase [Cytobacillus firmus]